MKKEFLIPIVVAVLNAGLAETRDLARAGNLPKADRIRLAEALADLQESHPGLIRAIKAEYGVTSRMLDDFGDGRITFNDLSGLAGDDKPGFLQKRRIPRYFFHPERTKLIFATLYREMIRNASLPYGDANVSEMDEIMDSNTRGLSRLVKPNGIGRMLCALLVPALGGLHERKCRTECGNAATRLLLVLHAYRKNESRFPQALQALVPDYIAEVPADPFDGSAFRYDAVKGVIYSVGKDLADAGGSLEFDDGRPWRSPSRARWKTKNIVFGLTNSIEQLWPAEP